MLDTEKITGGSLSGLPPEEILQFATDHGMIDLSLVVARYKMQRGNYLDMHPYPIWQGISNKCWYTYMPDEKTGEKKLKKRNTRQEIEEVVIAYWEDRVAYPTIEKAFNMWNDRKLEMKKICTSTHIRNIYIFRKHFKEFGKKQIGKTTPEEWVEFLEWQVPKYDLRRKQWTNLKALVLGMLKLAKRNKLILWNPIAMMQELDVTEHEFRVDYKEDSEEVYDCEEVEQLIDYCVAHKTPQNLCIILLYATGLRVGEAVALKPEDIGENSVKVRRTETRKKVEGKSGYVYFVKDFPKTKAGIRETVLPDKFAWVLKKILEISPGSEYVFTIDGVRILERSIRKHLKAACREAGIPYKPPHKIRKTYGTILLDNGVDDRFIIKQMGHTNILTTERFYHFNRRSIDERRSILNSVKDFESNQLTDSK